ncbi:MAG TPA: cobyric acid synthase [Nitrososphaera sp.]|nr:cobyric acid synthase [Nitrososphaera sp.]
MIQGTSSGAGKSTIVTGLCRLLSDEGYRVSPFKSQNMSSSFFTTSGGARIAGAQAVQAMAARRAPEPRMNPILLKPLGEYRSKVYLAGRMHSEMHARDYYEKFVMQTGFPKALESLDSLRKENDVVVIEGAGSPAEINIARYDIANMLLAEKTNAPVVVAADIERGGCFASIVGTISLLRPANKKLVKGFLINKFRGDMRLLEPAIKQVRRITGKPVLGVIPKIEFELPEEDSLVGSGEHRAKGGEVIASESWNRQIDLVGKAIRQSVDMAAIKEIAGI